MLDEAERSHLFDLARTANDTASPRKRRPHHRTSGPACNASSTPCTTPPPSFATPDSTSSPPTSSDAPCSPPPSLTRPHPTNLARFTFLDEHATEFFPDWDDVANATVALLRVEAGRNPSDRNLSDLVGELATRSDDFRVRWAGHNVRLHDHGDKRFHHPVVGDLTLSFEELPLPADPGLTITAYTAEPGTASHDALALLASWAATTDQTTERNAVTTRNME